jgi:hypothetical protein
VPKHPQHNPPKRDADAIGKSIVTWTERRFGSRWAKWAALFVLIVPVIWSSREPIRGLIENADKMYEKWSKNHPKVPKVSPGRFVVGVLIEKDRNVDESVLRELQAEFWRHPAIEFARVDIPELPSFAFNRELLERPGGGDL